jgi:hypothetical protein
MANFSQYFDMMAPQGGWYGRILALRHRLYCLDLCFDSELGFDSEFEN